MNKSLVLIILFALSLKPVSAVTIQLQSGWNMFSIPVSATVDADTIRSKCGTNAKIWNYDPSTRNYADTTQLTPGLGYWIKLNSTCSVSVDGSAVSVSDFPSLKAGWNQIGTASQSLDFSTIRSSTNCNILSGPWLYNSSINNYNSSSTLNPGVGYWLRVSSICSLTSKPQACSDGTAYGQCSSVNEPEWCDPSTGKLILNQCNSPHNCPCPSDQSCNETTGSCYTPTSCDSNCKLKGYDSGNCESETTSGTFKKWLYGWGWTAGNTENGGVPLTWFGHFDYVQIEDFVASDVSAVLAANPNSNMKLLATRDYQYEVVGEGWGLSQLENWFQPLYAMGYRGVYFDNCGSVAASTDNYALLDSFRSYLHSLGCVLFVNSGDPSSVGHHVDAWTDESAFSDFWGATILWRMQRVWDNTGTGGITFVAANHGAYHDTQANFIFNLAAFLISCKYPSQNIYSWSTWSSEYEGATNFMPPFPLDSNPSHGWRPEMDIDCGIPLDFNRPSGSVMTRHFSKCTVTVNLTSETGSIVTTGTSSTSGSCQSGETNIGQDSCSSGVCCCSGNVQCPSLTYPTDRWQRVWYTYSTGACLGNGPDQTSATFDDNWAAGTVAYNQADDIEFHSSRTINFATAGTYTFTLGSDDGARLWIDDNLEIDKWIDRGYTTDSVTLQLKAGNHRFRIDYYENGGNAEVSFSYAQAVTLSGWKVFQNSTSNYLQNKSGQVIMSSSDATTVINAAIKAVASGDTIYIDAGTYILTDALGTTSIQKSSTPTSTATNVVLTFASGAIIKAPNNFVKPMMYLVGVSNWTIQGGEFDGNGANQPYTPNNAPALWAGHCIHLASCNSLIIQNMYVHDCKVAGLWAEAVWTSSSGIKFLNNVVSRVGANGMSIGMWGDKGSTGTMQGNTVSYCGDVGIDTEGDGIQVLNNVVSHCDNSAPYPGFVNSYWGIGIEAGTGYQNVETYTRNNVVRNNTVSYCSSGIAVGNLQGVAMYTTIDNNRVTSCGSGIWLSTGDKNTVTNNVINGNGVGYDCVQIMASTSNTVSGNSFSGVSFAAIRIDASSATSNTGSGNSWDSLTHIGYQNGGTTDSNNIT